MRGGAVHTATNRSGGIQGGISNGEPILFRVAFKPTATISKSQHTVTRAGEETELAARGRHDPCVLPRAVPMVEAMAALVLCDHALRQSVIAGWRAQSAVPPRAIGALRDIPLAAHWRVALSGSVGK